jgi:hypothetical protein
MLHGAVGHGRAAARRAAQPDGFDEHQTEVVAGEPGEQFVRVHLGPEAEFGGVEVESGSMSVTMYRTLTVLMLLVS